MTYKITEHRFWIMIFGAFRGDIEKRVHGDNRFTYHRGTEQLATWDNGEGWIVAISEPDCKLIPEPVLQA